MDKGEIVNSLEPLDTRNLSLNWPLWKQRFDTNFKELPENKKLESFLESVGYKGLKILYNIFPELLELNEDKAKLITLQDILTAFDSYCIDTLVIRETQNLHTLSQNAAKTDLLKDLNINSLRDLHSKLSVQADKCLFECIHCKTSYKERMIRDHLLAAITDDDVKVQLMDKEGELSVDHIFKRYEEISKYYSIWSLVLPWLSLRDVDSFSRASKTFKWTVYQYIANGNNITIDESCCNFDGIPDDMLLQSYKDKVTSTTLSRIKECYVKEIFDNFPGITRLTLRDITIMQDGTEIPQNIRDLSIIDCTIDRDIIQNWFRTIISTLEVLKLDNLLYTVLDTVPIILIEHEPLHSLTIRGGSIYLRLSLDNLKNLKIVAQKISSTSRFYCSNLEVLYYDVCQDNAISILQQDEEDGFNKSLRSLTTRRWPISVNLTQFCNLEFIRIIESVYIEPIHTRTALNALKNLKTIDIHHMKVNEDQQILMLNEDCVHHILQYLSLEDCMALGSTLPQLENVVRAFRYRKPRQYTISRKSLDTLPLLENLLTYKLMGNIVTKLTVVTISEEEFSRVLDLFPKLTELVIIGLKLADLWLVNHFPIGLQSFTEMGSEIANDLQVKLYPRLNLTLKTLHVSSRSIDHQLSELQNISELAFSAQIVNYGFLQFLRQNKDHMEQISVIGKVEDLDDEIGLLEVLRDMKKLKCLTLDLNDVSIEMLQGVDYPNLEKVNVSMTNDGELWTFLSICCPRNIQHLSIPVEYDDLGTLIAEKFSDLRHLEIRRKLDLDVFIAAEDVDDWMSLGALTKLEKLDVRGLAGLPKENILQLVNSLPNLVELKAWPIMLDTSLSLRGLLKTEGRKLCLNGVKY